MAHSSFSYHKTPNCCRGVSSSIWIFWKQWEMSWERSCLRPGHQWIFLLYLFYPDCPFSSLCDHLRSHKLYTLITTKWSHLKVFIKIHRSLLIKSNLHFVNWYSFTFPGNILISNALLCKHKAKEILEGKWEKKTILVIRFWSLIYKKFRKKVFYS